jgi:hypothetical protein
MMSWPSRDCGLVLLYIAAAPLVLFAAMLMILTSKLALALCGRDPVGELAELHPEAWAVLNLTGRCALALLFVGLLFRAAF